MCTQRMRIATGPTPQRKQSGGQNTTREEPITKAEKSLELRYFVYLAYTFSS